MYWGVVSVHVLRIPSLERGGTYHAQGPEHEVVRQQPRLLAEPRHVLALREAPPLGEGRQYVLHDAGAQAREEHDEEGDEVGVVDADAVFIRVGVVVRVGEELARRGPQLGEEEVGEEEERDEVEREAWGGEELAVLLRGAG